MTDNKDFYVTPTAKQQCFDAVVLCGSNGFDQDIDTVTMNVIDEWD